ncbi:chemotaxis protein CheY [Pontibacillus halophilus JSM 076056 = DSM 19796]|uniref:Chemotaxis protein CheY n=1 Tax=Pontibacillus halophilus JSM 076056 = DSM 19796 TaxID=1385510 RepID=A0A0A5GLK1_9BACI|nr:HD domain-containing phosphohydrolase [Pontibacillus halophilus]KGX92005.1 chemotaxis protein CheY [Pontibacillus halophilus JSM 076056 = DSM 19796]
MTTFQSFQRSMFLNYVFGSLIAVFGVGSLFIFHTLTLTLNEIVLLILIMVGSVGIMGVLELRSYFRHVEPIKKWLVGEQTDRDTVHRAYIQLHRFPMLTVKRILGPHLFGLSVPASLVAYVCIERSWIDLPLIYIVYAWAGAILIAIMHALIEFYLTARTVQHVLRTLHSSYSLSFSLPPTEQVSMKGKLLASTLFTALFPVLLFVLASQVRLSEGRVYTQQQYWSWASVIVAAITCIALVSALLLFRNMESPILELEHSFQAVSKGEFREVDNVYSDEFSSLVTGFNDMVKGIKVRDHRNEALLESFFTVFAATLDARDPYTAGHSERVAAYSVQIATYAGWEEDQIDLLRKSALLHDIGKIGVRDAVLLKEGRLTAEEFSIIQQHPAIGERILKQVQLPAELHPILPGVRHHHERYDGKGYPDQLSGEDIPIFGRIMAVADAYDAMTSDRPYRKGMPIDKALRIIEEGKGTQWDPYFAELFLELMTVTSYSVKESAAGFE